MAIIMNAKGTSQSSFRIGKRGSRLYGTSDAPSDVNNISTGDLWFDSSNTLLKIATVSGGSVTWDKLTVGDADTLDSINSTSFARVDTDNTFANDITITGNLTVNGTQSIINTETLNIADNEIVLNSDLPSNQPATANAGILVNRGNESNVYIRWDEDEGEWTVNGQTFSAGAFVGNLSGNVIGSIAPNGAPNVVKANTLIVNGVYTMPTADGSANQVLTTDGSGTVSFANINATPGGSNTQIQYNDEGSFNGSSAFTYDESEAKLSVGGAVSSILFETVSDYGAITASVTDSLDYGNLTDSVVALVNSDYGVVETSGGPVEFPRYAVLSVPDASAYIGHMIYVTNETGGPVMAFSDGTNWRRVTDRAVIS